MGVSKISTLASKQRKTEQPLKPESGLTYYTSCQYGSNEIKCAYKWQQYLCCDIYYVGTTSQPCIKSGRTSCLVMMLEG